MGQCVQVGLLVVYALLFYVLLGWIIGLLLLNINISNLDKLGPLNHVVVLYGPAVEVVETVGDLYQQTLPQNKKEHNGANVYKRVELG